jgi:hypothetical protein
MLFYHIYALFVLVGLSFILLPFILKLEAGRFVHQSPQDIINIRKCVSAISWS